MFLVSLASSAATSGSPDLIVTTCSLGEACEIVNEVLDLDYAGRDRLERALDALQPGQVIEVKRQDGESDVTLTSAIVMRIADGFEVVAPFEAGAAIDRGYLAQRQVEEDCDREAVVAEDGTVTRTRTFRCWDDSGTEIDIEAPTADEAAQEYVDGGDWGEQSKTWWCSVTTVELVDGEPDDDTCESHTIAVEPDEPKCSAREHEWRSPFAIVGGIKENPGVFGHGGGVKVHEVCVHCGCERVTDTWAQNPVTGEQGLRSVEYHAGKYADEVAALASEEE